MEEVKNNAGPGEESCSVSRTSGGIKEGTSTPECSPPDGNSSHASNNKAVDQNTSGDGSSTQENTEEEDEVEDEEEEGDGRGGGANEQHEEKRLVIEQPLLTMKEVFVYRVPPLRAASGHRAEEWGLANPVFTGVLKMAQVGDACCLRLFKPSPEGELGAVPELFAECEVRLENGRTVQLYVEPVIDSSRYFVLRCEDKASGRHAYVGIGFRERSSAFDLKAVLDDFVRFLDRQKKAQETAAVEEKDEDNGPVKQVKDLSIADGQKVHIDLKVTSGGSSGRARRRPRSDAAKAAGGAGLGLLAPPPMPGTTYKAAGAVSPPTATSPRADTSRGANAPPPSPIKPPDVSGTALEAAVAGGDEPEGRDGDGEDDGWGEFESA